MKARDDGVDCHATTPSSRGASEAERRGDPVASCDIKIYKTVDERQRCGLPRRLRTARNDGGL